MVTIKSKSPWTRQRIYFKLFFRFSILAQFNPRSICTNVFAPPRKKTLQEVAVLNWDGCDSLTGKNIFVPVGGRPSFLPCDAMRCTVFVIVILSVRQSVRPSVTLVHCVHMVRLTIMISSLYGSPIILVSGDITFIPKFEGDHPERGRRMRWGGYELAAGSGALEILCI